MAATGTVVLSSGVVVGHHSIYTNGAYTIFNMSVTSGSFPPNGYRIISATMACTLRNASWGTVTAKYGDITLGSFAVGGQSGNRTCALTTDVDWSQVSVITLYGNSDGTQIRGGSYVTVTIDWEAFDILCKPPTSVALDASIAENSTILRWSGAKAGEENPITGYGIQFRSSSDGVNWSAWQFYAFHASTSSADAHTVYPHPTRGAFYQFQVSTCGALGNAYDSIFAVCWQTLQKNRLPTVPSVCQATPKHWENGSITISWSGTSDSDGNLSHYEIQSSTFTDGVNWGAWTALFTSATEGASHVPSLSRGSYIKYRVRAVDSCGGMSDWMESNSVRRNILPSVPQSLMVTPVLFESGSLSLAWDAATDADGNITAYRLDYRTSADGEQWSNWISFASTESLYAFHAPNLSRGYMIQYRVCAVDNMGAASDYCLSAVSRKNRLPGKPASFLASPAILGEGDVTLAWTVSTDSDGNLSHYELQSCTCADGVNWGAWTALFTSATEDAFHAPSLSRGSYIKYRVRAVDSLSAVSDWTESNAIRRNSIPSVPQRITADPAVTENGEVTIRWDASSDADNNLAGYRVYVQTSSDLVAWAEEMLLSTVSTTTATVQITLSRGRYARFLVEAYDALDGVSQLGVSNAIRRNTLPGKPGIIWPSNGAVCASGKPFLRVALGAETDGQEQRVQLRVMDGESNQVMAYTTLGRCSGAGGELLLRCPQSLEDGTYTLSLRTLDALDAVSSSAVTVSCTVTSSTWKRAIASGDIIADTTVSHQEDMLELLAEVNRARNYVGLEEQLFSQEIGYFARWQAQMQELRSALGAALAATGQVINWITIEGEYPRAYVVNELRSATSLL